MVRPVEVVSVLAGMLPAGLGNGAPAGREHVLSALPHTYLRPQDLPPAFSWGLQDGRSWLTLTRNQHMPRYCNSGWAHAPTSALADRVSIMNNATKPPMGPAPQVLLNCYEGGDCTGGDAGGIYAYAKQFGIPDDTVQSYHAEQKQCQPHGRAERCSYNLTLGCHDVDLAHHEHYPLYTVAEYGGVSGADNMKAEILARGPISCGILTSASFENYSAGVLQLPQPPTQNAPLNHEVSIVGWGRDEHAGEYWDVRNSYGSAWGESGYARIKMHGTNGGLETRCSWGVPRVNTSVPGAVPNAESSSHSQPDVPQQAKVVPRGPQHRPPKSGLMRRTKPRRSVVVSPLPQDFIADEDVPAAYDVRNILGWDYSTTSRAQNEPHACGSCWAQGTVSSISDRMKLMRKAAFPEITLSVQVLLDCANGTTSWDTIQTGLDNDNCGGGEPDDVMAYLLNHGVPDDTCSSYLGVKRGCSPENICRSCPHDGCVAVRNPRRYHIIEHGEVFGELNITKEIYARGPIAATIADPCAGPNIYPGESNCAFEEYRGAGGPPGTVIPGTGIFNDTTGIKTEDHIVEIAGWGEEKGIKYWIIRNSWGTFWGESGWGRVIRGVDNLGIESNDLYWALPDARDFP